MIAVQFSDQITLGALVIASIGALVGLYRVALGARLKATNEVLSRETQAKSQEIERLDRERSRHIERLHELGAEKDTALAQASACQATVDALTAQIKQMPKYDDVIRLFGEQMNRVDSVGAERTKAAVTQLSESMKHAERRAEERHAATLRVLQAIEGRLNGELEKGRKP